jgi:uncharacterized protein
MSNGVILSIFPRDKLAEDANVTAMGSGYYAMTLAHNVGSEKDVNAVIATVKKLARRSSRNHKRHFGADIVRTSPIQMGTVRSRL